MDRSLPLLGKSLRKTVRRKWTRAVRKGCDFETAGTGI